MRLLFSGEYTTNWRVALAKRKRRKAKIVTPSEKRAEEKAEIKDRLDAEEPVKLAEPERQQRVIADIIEEAGNLSYGRSSSVMKLRNLYLEYEELYTRSKLATDSLAN